MSTSLARFWSRLRSERGDADPVLTIVSMFLSAMITTVVLGAVVLIIQFGSNFVTDQVRSTSLATAQKAWSQDAANASQVKVRDASQATFYEEPGYRPGVYVPRGDDIADQCRKSVWTVAGGVLTDVVSKFSEVTCDLVTIAGVQSVDTTIKPVSTTTTLTLTGVSSTTEIVATNAAGRDLHYISGVEIGLVAGSAAPSTNTRAAWWRDYEWVYPQPARINLVGKVLLPVSGLRTSTLRGDTSIAPTSQGPTLGSPEVPPTATVYDPTRVTNLTVTRSSTVGAIYPVTGGVREGINVKFGGVSCGPYSTQYDISWATTTPGATPSRSVTEVTFDAPLPVDLDKVQNGAVGQVTVVASCPTSTKPSTVSSPYTQPLPTPVLTATAGTPPNVHTLSWGAVTSLAATYSTELSRDGGAFTADSAVSPNPTAATTETVTYPLGSTYGVAMASQVTAAVGPTLSSPSQPKTILTPWPAIISPTLTPTSVGLLLTVTSSAAVCPAGTHPEYSQTLNLNGAGTQPPSPWSTNQAVRYVLHEGDQAVVFGTAHCVYVGNQPSPASPPVTITFVQPITTMPNPPVITWVDAPNDSDPVNPTYLVPAPAGGCPAGTTVDYRTQYLVSGTPGTPLTSWSTWSTTTTTPIHMHQGDQLALTVAARCVSPYTAGPPATTTGMWPRPIPAPAAPVAGHDAGGVSAAKDDRFTYTAINCPVGSSATYLRDWFVAGVGSGNDPIWVKTLNLNVATNWGFVYNYTVHARCESPYAVSGSSPAASTSWPTPIPAPSGSPVLNLSTNSVKVNTNFNVYLSGAFCQPNLQLRWNVTPTGGQVTGSFTTHLTTTGWHTYTANAFCHSPYSGRNGPAVAAPNRYINVTAPVAGYPGGPTAYNVQSGCPWPQGYTPQQNVGFRLNASNGLCYYQTQQPVRDLNGTIIVGQWLAWTPSDPGQWYANNTYTG